jgi:hypothetical protein
MSVLELQAEIDRRRSRLSSLEKHADRLAEELESVREEIAALGGVHASAARATVGGRRGRRRRARNKVKLVDALADLLKGATMSVTDAAAAVQRRGYRTRSKTFRTIVNHALSTSGRFKKIARGQYTAK